MRLKKKYKIMAIILLVLGVVLVTGVVTYQYQMSPVDKNSNKEIKIEIESGTTSSQIANILKEKGLIHNAFFFKVYIKLNKIINMKASSYTLKKNMNMKEIVKTLVDGTTYNKDVIRLTFHEGKTIESYAKMLAKYTNIKEDEFLLKMKDANYLTTLINKYWFLTEDILQSDIYYGLEGYLAPDTYEIKNKNVTVEEIILMLLDQEEKNLTPYKDLLEQNGIHNSLTLASMAELEGIKEEDRKQIVGVFQNRLNKKMSLGSDVTTYYAFHEAMTSDLTAEMFNTYNPYNTRSSKMAGRLPIGPICNPSKTSIEAALNPIPTNALYFVADKNGKIYYTQTEKEHNKIIQEIKDRGDWIW